MGRLRSLRALEWAVAELIAVIGALLMILLLIELSAPPGAGAHPDFLAFYGAARLLVQGEAASLYDSSAMSAVQRLVIPHPIGANGYMPFINPPVVAVAFAPFGALSEPLARWLWAALNAVLMVGCAVWIARGLHGPRRLLGVLVVVASYPVYHTLVEGQWSIVLLAAGLAALECARRGSWASAGLVLSVFWLKPQFIVLPLVALIVARRWRAVVGAGAGAVAFVLVSVPFTGPAIDVRYIGYLAQVALSHFTGAGAVQATVWQGDLASTEGLNGLLVGYLGQAAVGLVDVLWAGLAAGVLALCVVAWRAQAPGFGSLAARAQLAAGIALVLLVNPNLFAQDCVLVFLLIDALFPLPTWTGLWGWTIAAALGDLVLLDQPGLRPHLFTLVLVAAMIGVCGRAIGRRTAAEPALVG
jgi:hypothetical protein